MVLLGLRVSQCIPVQTTNSCAHSTNGQQCLIWTHTCKSIIMSVRCERIPGYIKLCFGVQGSAYCTFMCGFKTLSRASTLAVLCALFTVSHLANLVTTRQPSLRSRRHHLNQIAKIFAQIHRPLAMPALTVPPLIVHSRLGAPTF